MQGMLTFLKIINLSKDKGYYCSLLSVQDRELSRVLKEAHSSLLLVQQRSFAHILKILTTEHTLT